MPDPVLELEELAKVAEEASVTLTAVSKENTQLHEKVATQDSLIKTQTHLLDAYAHVFTLVKEGEIDVSQAEEELDRILKLGLTTYKAAAMTPGAAGQQSSFGEVFAAENSLGSLENTKIATMLDGRQVNVVEAWLLQWRELRQGTPSGLVA